MSRSRNSALALFALSVPMLLTGAGRAAKPAAATSRPDPKGEMAARNKAASQLANLPIYFEPNRGQTDASVSYLAKMGGTRLFLTRDSAVFTIQKGAIEQGKKIESAVVRMRTVNSSRTVDEALDRLPGNSNYLIGRDKSKWVTDVPQFGKVTRRGIYPGVDLVFYGTQRQLEYDFVLAPGADPNRIELAYDGVDSIKTNGAGDLVLATAAGDFIQKKPKVYQKINGRQTEVAANYRISQDKSVRFEVARYDRSQALVIDPVIVFNAIIGSSGVDFGYGVAIDSSLNTYVAGYTNSADFPLASPFQSTFTSSSKIILFKLNSTGSALVYSTYIGGEGSDYALGLAVDGSGNAYVGGSTNSTQYPTVSAAQPTFGGTFDEVVTKVSASGSSLIYSTYIGGSGNDEAVALAIDPGNNAYIVGYTDGAGAFPVTGGVVQPTYAGGAQDCIVTKLGSAGSLVYSTYLGGNQADQCNGVAADNSGSAYVTGQTYSTNFPATSAAAQTALKGRADAFVTKLAANGSSLAYSTFFGGSDLDSGRAIAVDVQGNAYIAGQTFSTDLPVVSSFQTLNRGSQNAFVAKVVASGGAFSYSTYLGGRKSDYANGIAVDSNGNAYVVGAATSDDFPVSNAVLASKPGVGGILMKSSDSGNSFSSADPGILVSRADGVYVNPSNGYLFLTANGAIYESNNAGGSWVQVNLSVNNSYFAVAGFAPSRSNSNVIYAYPGSSLNYVWKTTDGGNSWNLIVSSSAAFSVTSVSVSPTDPNFLMASSPSGGVYTSSNGGSSWFPVSSNIAPPFLAVALISDSFSAVACSTSPGGVYRTTSGGSQWNVSNAGILSSSTCNKIFLDPNSAANVYLSTNDGLYKSVTGGANWSLLSSLPVASPVVAVANGNSNLLIAGGLNGGIYRSTDGGNSWALSTALSTTTITGLAISPSSSSTVYASTDISGEKAGFITVLNNSGSGYSYSTYLGGNVGTIAQQAQSVAVDTGGNAYIVGYTASPYYTATSGALNQGYGGLTDIFVTKISPSTASCLLSFANSTITSYPAGGSYPIEVFAPSGCSWSASSNASWLSLSGVSSGTGSASTRIVVASNTGSSRSSTISFSSGQSITVNQSAGSCGYTFSPSSGSINSAGGSGSASLSTGSGCGWAAVSSEPWLTISNNSGTNSGTINYSVTANTGTTSRTAVISVGTGTFTLTQTAPAQANYTGSVDAASCAGITGWIADRNRPNVPLVVTLWYGGTQIASATANLSRPDVGTVVGDNGLHGFSLAIPSAYQNGVANTYQIRYETSSTQVYGSPVTLTCGTTSGPNYAGYVDSATCAGITGWAADKNRPNVSLVVSLWDGNTQIASVTANNYRGDLGGIVNDNGLHGFNIPIPSSYANGVAHTLQIRYETSSSQLPNSPATLTCGAASGTNYAGSVDSATCAGIVGWAADKNRLNTPIVVSLWDGNTQIASVTANLSRPDVGTVIGDNGQHGFNLPIPTAYQNGVSHTLQVRYETSTSQLYLSPVTLTCGAAGTNYAGYVDSASCSGITGWAADRNRLNQSIVVSLWDGNTQIASTIANLLRSDVGSYLGDNGLHAFKLTLPSGYSDGIAHSLQVRYETSSTQLPGSPVSVTCGSAGTNYAGYIDSASCSGITGWAADRNRLNTSIVVSLWDGSTQIASVTANGLRSDVGSYLGDNGLHSFVLPIPSNYANGVAHTLQIRYEASTSQLPGSPATLTCGSGAPNYTGSTDSVSCTSINGWAADKNALNTPINVSVYDGTILLTTVVANLFRADVGAAIGDNGNHAFSIPTPTALKDGLTHTVRVLPGSGTSPLYGPQTLSGCR